MFIGDPLDALVNRGPLLLRFKSRCRVLPIKMSITRNSKGWEAHSPAFQCNVEVYSMNEGIVYLWKGDVNKFGCEILTRHSRNQTGLKFQMPNSKSQINPKFQSQMTKTLFFRLEFGPLDFICDLVLLLRNQTFLATSRTILFIRA